MTLPRTDDDKYFSEDILNSKDKHAYISADDRVRPPDSWAEYGGDGMILFSDKEASQYATCTRQPSLLIQFRRRKERKFSINVENRKIKEYSSCSISTTSGYTPWTTTSPALSSRSTPNRKISLNIPTLRHCAGAA